MYSVGDKIRYQTTSISYLNGEKRKAKEKIGVIEEVINDIENNPWYWVEGETELIANQSVIGKA